MTNTPEQTLVDNDDDVPFFGAPLGPRPVPPTVLSWRSEPPVDEPWPHWWVRQPCCDDEILSRSTGVLRTDDGEEFEPADWDGSLYAPAVPPPAVEQESHADLITDLPFPPVADDTFPPAGTAAPAIPWTVLNQIHADTFRAAMNWLGLDEVRIVGLGDLVVRIDVTSAIERLARPDDLRPQDMREHIIRLAELARAELAKQDRLEREHDAQRQADDGRNIYGGATVSTESVL